eukprot:Skav216718  [mRNA]  locus=scaffold91:764030:769709:- [translate_table: standard]
MFPWLWASILAALVGADTVSIGVTNGTGDTNLSVCIDFGDDNSKCGPDPVCDALNASCLAENPPKLQLQLCQEIMGVMSVEYVTGATEQISNSFYNTNCEGTPLESEVVTQGACTARGDNDEEARQYFPLVGVCNNGSTGDFVKHYVSEPQGYSSPIEYPTDVCLSNGEGESKVLTIHEEKVFRVIFEDSTCTGEPESVDELSSATISEVSCLDFASVNIDWNLDGVINNDGRNGTELVAAEVGGLQSYPEEELVLVSAENGRSRRDLPVSQ